MKRHNPTTLVQAYYAPLHGRWRCPFEFVITDEQAFRDSPMRGFDKLRLRMMVWLAKWTGALTMHTSLDFASHGVSGVMLHRTWITKWGMPLMLSRESITMDANGRDFLMRGGLRLIPSYWNHRSFGEGRGSVDVTSTRASYDFDWLGIPMHQESLSTLDAVTLTQTTAFSRGVQRLQRA